MPDRPWSGTTTNAAGASVRSSPATRGSIAVSARSKAPARSAGCGACRGARLVHTGWEAPLRGRQPSILRAMAGASGSLEWMLMRIWSGSSSRRNHMLRGSPARRDARPRRERPGNRCPLQPDGAKPLLAAGPAPDQLSWRRLFRGNRTRSDVLGHPITLRLRAVPSPGDRQLRLVRVQPGAVPR